MEFRNVLPNIFQLFLHSIVLLRSSRSIVGDPNCPSGWKPAAHIGSCIRIITDVQKTWNEARAHCQAQGADLVVLWDVDMEKFVKAQLPSTRTQTFWIGLSFDAYEGKYVWVEYPTEYQSGGYRWEHIPRTRLFEDDCLTSNGTSVAQWNAGDCGPLSFRFICALTDGSCPETAYVLKPSGTCIKLHKESASNVAEAQAVCKEEHAQVGVYLDQQTNLLHKGNGLNYTPDFWEGFKAQMSKDRVIEPNGDQSIFPDNNCAHVNTNKSSGWLAGSCTDKNNFICELIPACGDGLYGLNCSLRCPKMCAGTAGVCFARNGTCVEGCEPGYGGVNCDILYNVTDSKKDRFKKDPSHFASLLNVVYITLAVFGVYGMIVAIIIAKKVSIDSALSPPNPAENKLKLEDTGSC